MMKILPKVNFTDGSTVETLASSISEDAGLINVNVELSIATEKTVTDSIYIWFIFNACGYWI